MACQEELLSKSQTVHKESFCLHSQSSRKVAPRSWLHLCALTEQLRASSDAKQALSPGTLQEQENCLGDRFNAIAGCLSTGFPEHQDCAFIDGGYVILSLEIGEVEDLSCSLLVLSS